MNKKSLKKPFFALAPMANITTYPFASQCIRYGADLVWTPMVHTDTIINNWPEAEKILDFKEIENYIVQLVGSDPERFSKSVEIVTGHLKPLGIDLNFACPDKNIVKSGCGGALIRDTERMVEIVKAVKKVTKLPVSVKTRAGFESLDEIFDFAPKLASAGISMLTVHPRTVTQGFRGQADWKVLNKLVSLLSENHPGLILIGSGDVTTWQGAIEAQKQSGVDGVMIGRAALGRPWIFEEIKSRQDHIFDLVVVKELTLELSKAAFDNWGYKGIVESRTHFANYFRGFPEAKEYRKRLMAAETVADVRKCLTT